MNFELDTVASQQTWSDILNFHNSDNELYDLCGASADHGATVPCTLQLYGNFGGAGGGILSGVFTTLLFARDGSTNKVNAWLNGVQILSNVDDTVGNAIFNDTNNIIRFFQDDPGTSTENSGGTVRTIKIYDQAYTPRTLPSAAVPEPGAGSLLIGGVLLLAGKLRRS